MKEIFKKSTLFSVLTCLVICVGLPFGLHALTLNGGAMLGGVLVLELVLFCGFVLFVDRVAVKHVKPITLSLIEFGLLVIAFVIYYIF